MSVQIAKAVIPIAGLGSRFLPATKCLPKEMLPVFDRPVIELIVRELAESGVEEVVFVIPSEGSITPQYFAHNAKLAQALQTKGKQAIVEKLREVENLVRVTTVMQHEPLGDGDAVLQAKDIIGNELFFAYFGDEIFDAEIPTPQQLMTALSDAQKPSCVLGIRQVEMSEVSSFGIVTPRATAMLGRAFEIIDFIEKPTQKNAPSNLALIGKNLCTPRIFEMLEGVEATDGDELRLIDAFIKLQQKEDVFGQILIGKRFDVGNPKGLLEASQHYAQKMMWD